MFPFFLAMKSKGCAALIPHPTITVPPLPLVPRPWNGRISSGWKQSLFLASEGCVRFAMLSNLSA
jgi:hypothetical protein